MPACAPAGIEEILGRQHLFSVYVHLPPNMTLSGPPSVFHGRCGRALWSHAGPKSTGMGFFWMAHSAVHRPAGAQAPGVRRQSARTGAFVCCMRVVQGPDWGPAMLQGGLRQHHDGLGHVVAGGRVAHPDQARAPRAAQPALHHG